MSGDQAVTLGRCRTTSQSANGLSLRKSATADTAVREWSFGGDNRTFYFIPQTGDTALVQWRGVAFGYFLPEHTGDAFCTMIAGDVTFNSSTSVNGLGTYAAGTFAPVTTNGFYVIRSAAQVGGSMPGNQSNYANASTITAIGSLALVSFPNPSNTGVYVAQMIVYDNAGSLRGRMPGWYMPLHALPFANGDTINGITNLGSVVCRVWSITQGNSSLGQGAIDVVGPWT
jgi:hypothetical protein